MNIHYLIKILEAKIANLGALKTSAELLGDIDRAQSIELEISETALTLSQLRSL